MKKAYGDNIKNRATNTKLVNSNASKGENTLETNLLTKNKTQKLNIQASNEKSKCKISHTQKEIKTTIIKDKEPNKINTKNNKVESVPAVKFIFNLY